MYDHTVTKPSISQINIAAVKIYNLKRQMFILFENNKDLYNTFLQEI